MSGEEIVIAKAGKPLVKLIPYETIKQPLQPGGWEGKVKISDDFDEDLPDSILVDFHRKSIDREY